MLLSAFVCDLMLVVMVLGQAKPMGNGWLMVEGLSSPTRAVRVVTIIMVWIRCTQFYSACTNVLQITYLRHMITTHEYTMAPPRD